MLDTIGEDLKIAFAPAQATAHTAALAAPLRLKASFHAARFGPDAAPTGGAAGGNAADNADRNKNNHGINDKCQAHAYGAIVDAGHLSAVSGWGLAACNRSIVTFFT